MSFLLVHPYFITTRPDVGNDVESFGVMPAAYDAQLAEVQQAHGDPAHATHLFYTWTAVATAGTEPWSAHHPISFVAVGPS